MSQPLPLEGVKVVEFCHVVMGPTCGLVLADMGAEVIKVEPLEGDHTRKLVASGAGFFPTYNRNKKSVAVDLKSSRGREVVLKLIASADVLTENFRPGAMDRLGFGYDALRKVKPELTTPRINVPITVPVIRPTPPESEAPPITAAAMASSSYIIPMPA